MAIRSAPQHACLRLQTLLRESIKNNEPDMQRLWTALTSPNLGLPFVQCTSVMPSEKARWSGKMYAVMFF